MVSINNKLLTLDAKEMSSVQVNENNLNPVTLKPSFDVQETITNFENGKLSVIDLKKSLADAGINYTETNELIKFTYLRKNYTIYINLMLHLKSSLIKIV